MGCFREETEKTQVTFNGNGILSGIQVNCTQAMLNNAMFAFTLWPLPSAAMATWQEIQQAVRSCCACVVSEAFLLLLPPRSQAMCTTTVTFV